ncbi:MAG: ketoacyl-ACP synthase III [Acidobacteria bacterium]|nr:ketoacyl-ACP synthase III [Acidobacteriota bacterium]
MSLSLLGLGHFHSEVEITNGFLEELEIGTNREWILERVGIETRRTVLPLDYIRDTRNSDPSMALEAALYSHADTGKQAAEMAMRRAGIAKEDIGLVIAGSSRPEMSSPADACAIADALELEVPSFDINSACTSMWAALYMLSMMRPESLPDLILLVTPETLTTTVDYSDRSASVLWGDCTTAAVLSTRLPGRARILGNTFASSPAGRDKVVAPLFGHFDQEGRTVQMFAIKKTIRCLRELKKAFPDTADDFHFIGHQANLLMLQTVCQRCDIDDAHHHSNVVEFGNTGAAGAPSVVSMNWDRWQDGDDVAIIGVGSGLSWSSYLLRFGDLT